MAQISPQLLELSFEYLSKRDLAILARTSREVNLLVTPYLYRSIHLHCAGHIGSEDPVLKALDTFANPHFSQLLCTNQVYVSGSWYNMYKEIESELGSHKMLSPAVKLFNSIIASCIMRMPKLKVFIWDMQVCMSQTLVTSVMKQPRLESIQLRLGSDSLPKPFFHPIFEFQPLNIKVMRFVQINDSAILRSLGLAISRAVHLQELSILADEDSGLSLHSLLDGCYDKCPFQLRCLDLIGFGSIGITPNAFWSALSPSKLHRLTLHFGGKLDPMDYTAFWDESIRAGLRPTQLSTNLIVPDLKDFISSFTGLEVFNFTPPAASNQTEPILSLLQALQENHSRTLKALAIHQNESATDYTLDLDAIEKLGAGFPKIEEFRFGLVQPTLQIIEAALCCFSLKTLHVLCNNGVDPETKMELLDSILQYQDEGYASDLKYIVFDDDPVYRVLKSTGRRLQKQSLIGYISDSALLRNPFSSWTKSG